MIFSMKVKKTETRWNKRSLINTRRSFLKTIPEFRAGDVVDVFSLGVFGYGCLAWLWLTG
jgi:hypothetical protein